MDDHNDALPISLPFPAILEALVLQLTDKQFKALQTGRGVPANNKYRNCPTTCSFGHLHPSGHEATVCSDLHYRQRGGEIRELVVQPRFNLVVNGEKICVYVGDWSYWDVAAKRRRVLDAKGIETPIFRLKRKLMKACLQIEVETV